MLDKQQLIYSYRPLNIVYILANINLISILKKES